ncbi:hypothetical protein Tco_0806216 [Tanacetum coccineum]
MLQICPKLPDQQFEELLFGEEILTFLRDLGHSGEIKVINDVNVNKLHQPWRSFAAVIKKCLSVKAAKPTKKKQTAKTYKAKGVTVLSEGALTEAEQIELATKRSLIQTHSSYTSGLGTYEGTGDIPRVPDVPTYESDDEQIS